MVDFFEHVHVNYFQLFFKFLNYLYRFFFNVIAIKKYPKFLNSKFKISLLFLCLSCVMNVLGIFTVNIFPQIFLISQSTEKFKLSL